MPKRHPRVLFICQYFHPEPGATADVIWGVARSLPAAGIETGAIAAQPSYHGTDRLPRAATTDGVRVVRVPTTQRSRHGIVGRLLNAFTFLAGACWHALRAPRGTLLIATTNPPFVAWLAWLVTRVRGNALRFGVLVHDVYPEIAEALGVIKPGGAIANAVRGLNRLAYRDAEWLVVLGRDMRRVIAGLLPPNRRDRVVLIPNWADGRAIAPRHWDADALTPGQPLRVQYSGNWGRFHEIETILAAARTLGPGAGVRFTFIGDGAQRDRVRAASQDAASAPIEVLSYQPRDNLGESLTACDVGLVTLKEGVTGLAVPSKLYGILAAGVPVLHIGPEDCEPALVIRESDCGMVVPPGDPEALADALRALAADRFALARMGHASRQAFEAAYDLPPIQAAWQALIHASFPRFEPNENADA